MTNKNSKKDKRMTKEKCEVLVRETDDCVKLFDINKNIIYINRSGLREHGLKSLKNAIEQKWNYEASIVLADRKKYRNAWAEALKGKVSLIEINHIPSKSTRESCSELMIPIKNKEGKVTDIFGISRDLTKIKEVEKKLIKGEYVYRGLFDNIPSGVAVYEVKRGGKQFIIKDFNKVAEKIEKVKKKDIVGKDVTKVFPGVKEFGLLDIFKKVWKTNKPVIHPITFYKDNRISGWRENYVYKLPTGEIIALYDDLTKQKQKEEELKEYKLLYETSSDAFMTLEPPSWKFTSGNPSTIKMFGLKNEKEFTTLGPWDVSPEYQPDGQLSSKKAAKMIKKAMKDGTNFFEWTHKKIRGESFPATVLLTKFNSKGKNILQATVRDVTKQKQEEEKLRLSEEKNKIVVENIDDGVMVIDLKNNITLFNKQASLITQYKEKEVLGKNYKNFFKFSCGCEVKRELNFIKKSIDGNLTEITAPDLELKKKNGIKIAVEGSSTPMKNISGEVIGAIIVFRDVTKRREVEKIKNEFISMASHQLRTPLSGVKWFSELLLDGQAGVLNKRQQEFVNKIYVENNNLILLTKDLLDVSNIEANEKIKVFKKDIKVDDMIKEVSDEMDFLIKQKKIKIEVYKDLCQKIVLHTDEEKLKHIFYNLINNAIKFSGEGKIIRVGCKKQKNQITFFVEDEGLGIPKSQQKNIYKKFFRASNVATKSSGTGLGLYMVKALVDMLGGKTWFESEENKGSTFYFSLSLK